MDEPRPKPNSLKLVTVELHPVPEHEWQKDFELTVQAFAEGASLLGVRTDARGAVIINWMRQGDLRPLAADIAGGRALDRGVGRALANLIAEGRLSVKNALGRRGAARQPRLFARNARIFLKFFERRQSVDYDTALHEIADEFRVSSDTVRKAVDQMQAVLRN